MPNIKFEKHYDRSAIRGREHAASVFWDDEQTTPMLQKFSEAIARFNIDVPDNTRYRQYIQVLENKSLDNELKITAYQEIFHLLVALENIKDIDEWRSTIATAIRYETAIPNIVTNHTQGRDALFELYVAGRLKAAGLSVAKGEPDIICSKNGFNFGIAAKRIKSKKKILIRAKEARKQIEKSKLPSIIALDLTPLQESYYGKYPIEEFNVFLERARNYLDFLFEPLLPEITKTCARKRVMGVIAFSTICALSNNGHSVLISPFHSGHRLCMPGTVKAQYMWEIVDLLGTRPLGIF